MTGSRFHARRSPRELTRCGGCGRLLQKATARPGPAGRLYGEECLPVANRNAAAPIIPAAYMPLCHHLDDTPPCPTPRDNVNWDTDTERFLCRAHRSASRSTDASSAAQEPHAPSEPS
jgi:hypothetical protein